MSRQTRAAWLLGAALLAPSAASLHAQVLPAANVTRPAAEAAQSAFRMAVFEGQNVGGARVQRQLEKALAADPKYGLAQAYEALMAPGLTATDRESRIAATLGAMGSATPAEVLLATWWRENSAGRGAAAVPVIRAAAELAPSDAEINYIYNNTQRVGKTPAEQVAILKTFVQKFPTHAAAFNTLAYTLWRTGDREGSLAAVQKYAELAPDHPNSHDSYADILILLGRGQEAIGQMEQVRKLEPEWGVESKLGTIALTRNDLTGARANFEKIVSQTTDPEDRIEAAYWLATTDLVAKKPMAATQQITRIAATAKQASLLGAVALAFDRLAVIDAYVGDRGKVAADLASAEGAATNNAQKATHQAHAAIALSRLGRAEEARAAVAQFRTLMPNSDFLPSLDALLALDRKDYPAAEAALGKSQQIDVLPRALRAELLLRTGRKAEGEALRKELMSASLKQDGNPVIEFTAIVGRLRLESL